MDVRLALDSAVADHARAFPLPGSGRTWTRFRSLSEVAARDLSTARLVEGHVDALAILAELGRSPGGPRTLYGVWASRSSAATTEASRTERGWRLSGSKAFCSGAGILDRALVTAEAGDGYRLFDVDLTDDAIRVEAASWPAIGMAASASYSVHFDGVTLAESSAVGPPGIYTGRPGFWFGSVGVAACWLGGAIGLVRHATKAVGPEAPHACAELGRAAARITAMAALVRQAAEDIDADPRDQGGNGRQRALATRQIVHDLSLEVLAFTAAAAGARPLCHDADQARRSADLFVYLAQHRGNDDAAELGAMVIADALPLNASDAVH